MKTQTLDILCVDGQNAFVTERKGLARDGPKRPSDHCGLLARDTIPCREGGSPMSVARVRLLVMVPLAVVVLAGILFLAGAYASPPATAETMCPGDNDCDGFSNSLENHVGTDHKDDCGPNAWPPDFNDDTFVDIFDIATMTPWVGQFVPPAPVRLDIGPEPEGDNFIWLEDLSALVNRFGDSCATP